MLAGRYAAFGSKEALYAEALSYYRDNFDALVWAGFRSTPTAREAVAAFLLDSAAALTGTLADIPNGCMVTLSFVGHEENAALGEQVPAARAGTFERLTPRFEQAVAQGEIPPSTDVEALARFVQAVQNGMSIMARDGATRDNLADVADLALLGWMARIGKASNR